MIAAGGAARVLRRSNFHCKSGRLRDGGGTPRDRYGAPWDCHGASWNCHRGAGDYYGGSGSDRMDVMSVWVRISGPGRDSGRAGSFGGDGDRRWPRGACIYSAGLVAFRGPIGFEIVAGVETTEGLGLGDEEECCEGQGIADMYWCHHECVEMDGVKVTRNLGLTFGSGVGP